MSPPSLETTPPPPAPLLFPPTLVRYTSGASTQVHFRGVYCHQRIIYFAKIFGIYLGLLNLQRNICPCFSDIHHRERLFPLHTFNKSQHWRWLQMKLLLNRIERGAMEQTQNGEQKSLARTLPITNITGVDSY